MSAIRFPRRKFDVKEEVCNIKRLINRPSVWTTVVRKSLIDRWASDFATKRLWIHGSKFSFIPGVTIHEIIPLFSAYTPEVKVGLPSKKIQNKPLFVQKDNYGSANGFVVPLKGLKTDDMILGYERHKKLHMQLEAHHPEGQGWFLFDSYNKPYVTFEVVINLFAKLVMRYSVATAWKKLLEKLVEKKYLALNTPYVYAALMHIVVRGVADIEPLKLSTSWRARSVSEAEIEHQKFLQGNPSSHIIAGYKMELRVHQHMVSSELANIRAPMVIKGKMHDFSKFSHKSVFFYAWKKGIWNAMSEVSRCRAKAGRSPLRVSDENARFTMYTMGNGMGKGFADEFEKRMFGEEVYDDFVKRFGRPPHSTADEIEMVEEANQPWIKRAERSVSGMMKEFYETATNLSSDFISRLQDLVSPVTEKMTSFLSSFDSLKNMLDGIFSKFSDAFSAFRDSGIHINSHSIIMALKCYIFYNAMESRILKTAFFLLMLESLGIVSAVVSVFMDFVNNKMFAPSGLVDGDEATPTSLEDVFHFIASSPQKLVRMVTLAFTQVMYGKKLVQMDILEILKGISRYAKEFHFIGGGILGLTRMFQACHAIFRWVMSWINKKFYGVTDEKRDLAKEVLKWTLEVKYFATEEGLTAIRANKTARDRASKLFSRGQVLLTKVSPASPHFDRLLYMDMKSCQREVKLIANFITRRKAMTGFQPTMFHIQLVGRPGIGKSTITKKIVRDLIANLWKNSPQDDCWSFNPNLQYFDGYTGQKIMIVDDMFRMDDPQHLTMLIGLVTNTPIVLPMANLEDKGTQMTSQILLSSTNTAYPRGKDILCMEAVHRRRHMLVNVECDPRVISESSGQFEKSLYDKFYAGQEFSDLPHLKFSLIRPQPRTADLEETVEIERDEATQLLRFADKLKEANSKILIGGAEIDPAFYFSSKHIPPSPLTLPCRGWDYKQLIANAVTRFQAFRGMEGELSIREKYDHVASTMAEIDLLFDQYDDIPQLDKPEIPFNIKPSKIVDSILLSKFRDLETPFIESGLEATSDERSFDIISDPDDLNLDEIFEEFHSSSTSSEFEEVVDSTKFTSLDLSEEAERRNRILRRANKTVRQPALDNALTSVKIDGRTYVSVNGHFTVWDNLKRTAGNSTYEMALAEVVTMMHQVEHLQRELPTMSSEGEPGKKVSRIIANMFGPMALGANSWIPNNADFPREFRGRKLPLNIELLSRVKIIDGKPYVDCSDIAQYFPKKTQNLIRLECNDEVHYLPQGPELIFSMFGTYSIFCTTLEHFTTQQVEKLATIAKFRNKYTGFYTRECVLDTIRKIYDTTVLGAKQYLTTVISDLISYLCDNKKKILASVLSLIAMICVILLVREIGNLFSPKETLTSKFLHRGPVSRIQPGTRFTSLFNSERLSNMFESVSFRNVRQIQISSEDRTVQSHALLSGQFMFLNKHNFVGMRNRNLKVTIFTPEISPVEYWIQPCNIYEDPEGDLACIYSREFPSARDIKRYLMTAESYSQWEPRSDLLVLSRDQNKFVYSQMSPYKKTKKLKFNSKIKEHEMSIDDALLVSGSTLVGRSGSPVFLPCEKQGGPILLGIQAWEINSTFDELVAFQVLTKEKYDDIVSRFGMVPRRVDDYDDVADVALNSAFTSKFASNVICNTADPPVGLIGKTSFKFTPIARQMDLDNCSSEAVPAVLNPADPVLFHGRAIHPLHNSLSKYMRGNVKPLLPSRLDYIRKALVAYIKPRLDTNDFTELSLDDVVLGTREDGSNPMNLASSPGIPYIWDSRKVEKGKKSFMHIAEDGMVDHMDEGLIHEFLEYKEMMAVGQVPLMRAYDFPKDELRPREKAYGGPSSPPKTRSVTCMNMLVIMLWREQTLKLWSSLHRAADGTFPLCPGINPEGPDWSRAYHYLSRFSKSLDFDVSNWDGFLPPSLFFLAGDVVCDLMGLAEDSYRRMIISSLLFDVMFAYIQFGDVIYQKNRGMVSGFPGTAEMNSLVHFILIIYIYLQLADEAGKCVSFADMMKNMSCLVYGDDIILTFSDEISDFFNGLSIKRMYEEIGYPVTAADKGSEIVLYKELSQCQFLKSSWVELFPGYYIRKMQMSVVLNLLYWVRASEQPLEQFYENIHDAMRIMFAYGSHAFQNFVTKINGWLNTVGLPPIDYIYDDFLYDYQCRYFTTTIS